MGIIDTIFRRKPPQNAMAELPDFIPDRDILPRGTPPQEDYKDLPIAALGNWNVGNVKAALAAHSLGQFGQSALLIDSLLGDGRIQTALNGRLKGVTMRHAHAEPAPGDTDGSFARVCMLLWPRLMTDEVLEQLWTWCVMGGWGLVEIVWEPRGDLWVPRLKPWHMLYTYYRIDTRCYVAITMDGAIEIDPSDPKWWLVTPWGEYRGWLRGAVRSCAPMWTYRQYALRDWARFSEIHGLPIKVLKPPAQAHGRDKDRMLSQVSTMSGSSTLMLPQQGGGDGHSWLLELLEAKDRAWEAFPGLIEQCDREIQQVIRGTNLTSEVQGGSYAAAQVHADEDSGYADSDCRKICESVRRIFALFLEYNFGARNMVPTFRLEAPDKADVLQLAQAQQFALTMAQQARELGWKIDTAKLAERYAIPLIGVKEPEPAPESEPADE